MTLRLITSAAYRIYDELTPKWRSEDYTANNFVHAVKADKKIKGYGTVALDGRNFSLNAANQHLAIEWFAGWAAKKIVDLGVGETVVLYPVPPSELDVGSDVVDYRTYLLADNIADICEIDCTVAPILRWNVAKEKSHAGGPRNRTLLRNNLTLIGPPPDGVGILIDDVCTTGNHLRACRDVLAGHGIDVSVAICTGRTVWNEIPDPFDIPDEDLD